MKIVYILDSLSSKSGTERTIIEKANYLSERFGYNVYIIVCTQLPEQPNAYNLSNYVKQIYLQIPYHFQYRYKYPKRLWIKISLYKQLKDSLYRVIRELSPDILIGTNYYIADIVCSINCNAKKIIECHITRNYVLSGKRSKKNSLSKLFIELYKKYYFKVIEFRANAIVTLTEEEKKLWNNVNRVEVIPNFSTMNVFQTSLCNT